MTEQTVPAQEAAPAPVFTVVSGSPTPEEIAAIVTVLTAAASGGDPTAEPRSERPRVSGWKSYSRTLRRAPYPGPGAWRLSGGPFSARYTV